MSRFLRFVGLFALVVASAGLASTLHLAAQTPRGAQSILPDFTSPPAGTAGGVPGGAAPAPVHLPPVMFGRLSDLRNGGFRFNPLRRATGEPPQVRLYSYTKVYHIVPIEAGSLQRGDPVLVEGVSAPGGQQFLARRLIRTAARARLAPGVALAQAAPEMAPTDPPEANPPVAITPGEAGAPTAGTAAAAAKDGGTTAGAAPGAAGEPVKPKQALRAEKRNDRAIQRGRLLGQVVSSNPLAVELFDGQIWTIDLQPGARMFDQKAGSQADLAEGAIVQLKGSEIGPGVYRAGEVNLLGDGLSPADLGGPGGLRRGGGGPRGAARNAGGLPRPAP